MMGDSGSRLGSGLGPWMSVAPCSVALFTCVVALGVGGGIHLKFTQADLPTLIVIFDTLSKFGTFLMVAAGVIVFASLQTLLEREPSRVHLLLAVGCLAALTPLVALLALGDVASTVVSLQEGMNLPLPPGARCLQALAGLGRVSRVVVAVPGLVLVAAGILGVRDRRRGTVVAAFGMLFAAVLLALYGQTLASSASLLPSLQ